MAKNNGKLDLAAIQDEAVTRLEARFNEVQAEMEPLRQEEAEIAEMIFRFVGQYPSGYHKAPPARTAARATATRSRSTLTEDERAARIVELVTANPGQFGYKDLADQIGVSPATITKTAKALIESGQLTSTGEKRSFRLQPA